MRILYYGYRKNGLHFLHILKFYNITNIIRRNIIVLFQEFYLFYYSLATNMQ